MDRDRPFAVRVRGLAGRASLTTIRQPGPSTAATSSAVKNGSGSGGRAGEHRSALGKTLLTVGTSGPRSEKIAIDIRTLFPIGT